MLYERAIFGCTSRHHGACPRGSMTDGQVRSVKPPPPWGLSPWGDDCWPGWQSWPHGDKPRGGHPSREIASCSQSPVHRDKPGCAGYRGIVHGDIETSNRKRLSCSSFLTLRIGFGVIGPLSPRLSLRNQAQTHC